MIQDNGKLRVGILFGGKSAEHEVSLQSAGNVFDAIDRTKFEPVLIGIEKNGTWRLAEQIGQFDRLESGRPVALVPESNGRLADLSGQKGPELPKLDVAFPILHGPFGEDGTVQGLLKLADIPFVGSGVLASAVGMDKDVMKRLFREAGIPIGRFRCLTPENKSSFEELKAELGIPMFVKPANMGSSVGIGKVSDGAGFSAALQNAFSYDTKVIVEAYVHGREIECAVLGNESPSASVPGEVIPSHDFYSYEAKYLDENGARLEVPAQIDNAAAGRIRALAVRAFEVLGCRGIARVDFFLRQDGEVLVNEINTMPGFTKISMYPKLWAASGIDYTELITRLITLALRQFDRERNLLTSR
ncbi:MAG: D-alanine--D-alanine ligase [Treponema sp.]|nr:D-alanine--D-alanine ligase [Treponema sp.]